MREYIEKIKDFCKKYGIDIKFENNNEFYFVPSEKRVHFGNKESQYNFSDLYKSYHELCHSTVLMTNRDTKNYAKEEVVADLSAGKILLKLGMLKFKDNPISNNFKEIAKLIWMHISYSGSWATAYIKDNAGFTFNDLKQDVEEEINKVTDILKQELEVC